jgi:hypothetical protein
MARINPAPPKPRGCPPARPGPYYTRLSLSFPEVCPKNEMQTVVSLCDGERRSMIEKKQGRQLKKKHRKS